MSNPNIRNLTSLTGNTAVAKLTTTNTDIVVNNSSSNLIYKVVNFIASNITGINNEAITVVLTRSGVDYNVAYQVTVPMNSTLLLLTKDAPLYVMEGDTLKAKATANTSIDVLCSYEVVQ
jgi:hypothetical protein